MIQSIQPIVIPTGTVNPTFRSLLSPVVNVLLPTTGLDIPPTASSERVCVFAIKGHLFSIEICNVR